MTDLYQQSAAFHRVFDDRQPARPTPLSVLDLTDRVGFILEELTELATTTDRSEAGIAAAFDRIEAQLAHARQKLTAKPASQYPPLVQQADALGDLTYLIFGSFVLMGVEPTPVLTAIHAANMHKQFPDGTAHRDPVTHKVLKPADWAQHYQPEPQIAAAIQAQTPD
ncbi:haloacid dehalogenase [Lacticaseibacillus absianus]|uniref:haloacid dehalogenase n=1 Tax=Lacticaseibacillus absianus TaxID=2729623 RepID=UPI0015C6B3CC|nr:haloacid dehalogenase [Lacticaseibacillus absianus]